jgi:NAD(P)-dependent dehydrogenase (short-subunit alcohol dehydrogenase family)
MRDHEILVTGGSGALGRAVSRALLERGARLTIPVFHLDQQAGLVESLGEHAAAVTLRGVDLRDEASVRALIDGMQQLHAVVHLVGGFAMGPTVDFAIEDARTQLELNVMTAFMVLKHALRRMVDAGYGRIVTVGSRAAVEPGPQQAMYAAAKAGLVALTRSIAAETKGSDITANCVLPSIIDTPQNRAAMGEAKAADWVKAESLAEVIAFYASPAARDIRGAATPVYGSV